MVVVVVVVVVVFVVVVVGTLFLVGVRGDKSGLHKFGYIGVCCSDENCTDRYIGRSSRHEIQN